VKKIFLHILFFIGSYGLTTTVFSENAIVDTTPAATQEYHIASDNTGSTSRQSMQAISPVSNAVAVTQPTSIAVPAANAINVDTSLQAQLSQLNQEILLYQQQSDRRIEAIASKNEMFMNTLNNVNQVVLQLGREVEMLRTTQAQLASIRNQENSVAHSSAIVWEQWFTWLKQLGVIGYLNFALVAVLLLTLGFAASKFRRNAIATTEQPMTAHENKPISDDDTRDEYHFMSTHEAIPAMLDLARAYVAMEDFSKAKTALQTVLEKGNDVQRREATLLFSKIK